MRFGIAVDLSRNAGRWFELGLCENIGEACKLA